MRPLMAFDAAMADYFRMQGRTPRWGYWWYLAVFGMVLAVSALLDLYLIGPHGPVTFNPLTYFTGFWVLANMIPLFNATVRRLHDTGRSGRWWAINLVPLLGNLWFLALLASPSDQGPNTYGPASTPSRGQTAARPPKTAHRPPLTPKTL